jgi:hypothetical protein
MHILNSSRGVQLPQRYVFPLLACSEYLGGVVLKSSCVFQVIAAEEETFQRTLAQVAHV